MTPSTLVPALTVTPSLPPMTAAEVIPNKHRVTLNLSVRDARNFSYLLHDIHVLSGERGEALNAVRVKLARQLKRCAIPQQFATAN